MISIHWNGLKYFQFGYYSYHYDAVIYKVLHLGLFGIQLIGN